MSDPSDDSAVRVEGLEVAHVLLNSPGRIAEPKDGALAGAISETRRLWTPPDKRLIATGHQATLRHPGILAKDLVASELSILIDARVLRLLVDQDVHQIGPLEVPASGPSGVLVSRTVPCLESHREAPTGRRPPIELDRTRIPEGLSPSVAAGVDAIDRELRRASDRASAAAQVGAALDALAAPFASLASPVAASGLLSTPLGLELLRKIAEDPLACARAFNDALTDDPRAARPLRIQGDLAEAPLWSIDRNATRQRVHMDLRESKERRVERLQTAAHQSPSRIAPRGLLMSGLVRLVADLFIHGRGGWRYDRVTERWFTTWLGVELRPMAMVSADLRLPIGSDAEPRERLRRRWHDPTWGGGSEPSPEKTDRLRSIAAAGPRSRDRREAFLEMHAELERLRALNAVAPPPARGDDPAAVAARRDWTFPLHSPEAISALVGDVRRAVALSIAPR
jgi:hypothetical protein